MDAYYHLQNYSEHMDKISEEHLIFFFNSTFLTFHIDGLIFKIIVVICWHTFKVKE